MFSRKRTVKFLLGKRKALRSKNYLTWMLENAKWNECIKHNGKSYRMEICFVFHHWIKRSNGLKVSLILVWSCTGAKSACYSQNVQHSISDIGFHTEKTIDQARFSYSVASIIFVAVDKYKYCGKGNWSWGALRAGRFGEKVKACVI